MVCEPSLGFVIVWPGDVHLVELILELLRLRPVQTLVLHVEHAATAGGGLGAHLGQCLNVIETDKDWTRRDGWRRSWRSPGVVLKITVRITMNVRTFTFALFTLKWPSIVAHTESILLKIVQKKKTIPLRASGSCLPRISFRRFRRERGRRSWQGDSSPREIWRKIIV